MPTIDFPIATDAALRLTKSASRYLSPVRVPHIQEPIDSVFSETAAKGCPPAWPQSWDCTRPSPPVPTDDSTIQRRLISTP